VDPAEETQTPIHPEQPPAEVFLDPVWTGGVCGFRAAAKSSEAGQQVLAKPGG